MPYFIIGFYFRNLSLFTINQDCSFSQPIPWDERCFLNVTTSICDDDSAERARIYVSNDSDGNPLGIFLCSDGIDDSYPVNDNEKYLSKFYRSLALNFIDKNFEKAFNDVREVLPLLSKKGSGDDMSLSCILNIDGISRNAKFLKGQNEEEENIKDRDIIVETTPGTNREPKTILESNPNSTLGKNIDIKP